MFGHDRKLKVREERLGVWSVIGVKGGGSLKCSNILYTILLEKKKSLIINKGEVGIRMLEYLILQHDSLIKWILSLMFYVTGSLRI